MKNDEMSSISVYIEYYNRCFDVNGTFKWMLEVYCLHFGLDIIRKETGISNLPIAINNRLDN